MTTLSGLPHTNAYLMQEVVAQNRTGQANISEAADRAKLLQDSSKGAVAAAVKERAQIDYDQPAEREQRAVGHYKAIATYSQRDQLQQMVGINVYV